MSLVICSNVPNEDAIVPQETSIFKPFQFRNHLNSTMTIPANSEVALQSAKITMNNSIEIGDGQRVFFQYFGIAIPAQNNFPTEEPQTPRNNTSIPLRTTLFEGATANGLRSKNVSDLSTAISFSMNQNILHPTFRNKISVESGAAVGTGEFRFNFAYNQTAQPDVRNTNANIQRLLCPKRAVESYIPARRNKIPVGIIQGGDVDVDWTWTAPLAGVSNAGSILKVDTSRALTQAVICNTSPITHKKGLCRYKITNVVGDRFGDNPRWFAGLTRASTSTRSPRRPINPPYYRHQHGTQTATQGFRDWIRSYIDFGVFCDADGILRVCQCVVNSIDTGGSPAFSALTYLPMFNIFAYDESAKGGLPPDYNFGNNPAGFTHIEFEVDAEQIAIVACDADAGGQPDDPTTWTRQDVYRYDATRIKQLNMKPISMGAWAMYPILGINNFQNPTKTKQIDLECYTPCNEWYRLPANYGSQLIGGFNVPNIASDFGWFPQTRQMSKNIAGATDSVNPSNDLIWNPRLFIDSLKGVTAVGVNLRNILFSGRANTTYKVDYALEVERTGLWRDLNQQENSPIMDISISTTTVNPYKYIGNDPNAPYHYDKGFPVLIMGQSINYAPSAGAGCEDLLGFQDAPIQEIKTVVGNKFETQSAHLPKLLSERSCFIRLDGLQPQSINARQGGRSNIIAHLPRFQGTQTRGAIFYEPSEKTYLDLSNPTELKVNSFDISVCYSDESLATNLKGATVIVLHIRPKRT
tara:strand:- start:10277 stop:12532 length:2256 start_codon:yes stop_codon:yes gene_type:complete